MLLRPPLRSVIFTTEWAHKIGEVTTIAATMVQMVQEQEARHNNIASAATTLLENTSPVIDTPRPRWHFTRWGLAFSSVFLDGCGCSLRRSCGRSATVETVGVQATKYGVPVCIHRKDLTVGLRLLPCNPDHARIGASAIAAQVPMGCWGQLWDVWAAYQHCMGLQREDAKGRSYPEPLDEIPAEFQPEIARWEAWRASWGAALLWGSWWPFSRLKGWRWDPWVLSSCWRSCWPD